MNPKVWISKIKINDGTEIPLKQNDILVFVGPNNAGKSAALREINLLIESIDKPTVIIKHVEIEKIGNESDLIDFLKTFSNIKVHNSNNTHYSGFEYSFFESNLNYFWPNYKKGLDQVKNIFVKLLSTIDRIRVSDPPNNIALDYEPFQHPIHFLQENDTIEKKLSEYFKLAFGTDLILDRNAGSIVPLRVGDIPLKEMGEDRVSNSYVKKVKKLPLLQEQGDGMRSFTGVLLYTTFLSRYSIVLIDEPEAFLHPPQAKLIGKMLAKDLLTDRQLFLATHSEDFLKGLLDSGNQNIKVVRIRREGVVNKVHILDKNDIKEIWEDSLLRHSNILGGLFHSRVVICESDSDCRFYSAILTSLFEVKDEIAPDILFLHCGGKHRIPIAIKALKKLDVPMHVVTDFDILNDENPFKEIIETLGGVWDNFKDDWRKIKIGIDGKRPELLKENLKEEIDKVFASISETNVGKEKIQEFSKLLKKASPWAEAKLNGKSFIPPGDASKAFIKLNTEARRIGLEIVEIGELESFDKSVGNHGPKWVNEVLKKDLVNDPELKEARDFVQRFV
ncbi:MAG: ATP-binding protein [Ignavibacteria bacterium]|nr:ATP-binding protein [Ignavibacteria bacterium]